jgi:hypothetical protein
VLTQLTPWICLQTPRGKAYAVAVIDYGPDHDLLWVCFQCDTGECWTWANPQVRADRNVTMGIALEPDK